MARSYPDRIIGVDNALPWHLGTDLKHFKERTIGHAVIMGRKTFESIGRPLPKRLSIILSRTKIEDTDNVKWARDPETALLIADQYSIYNLRKEFFVIGGEEIYGIFDEYINVVYLTEVNSGPINGDAKFSRDFDAREWWFRYEREFPRSAIDDHSFRICCIIRRKPFHRFAAKNNLLNDDQRAIDVWERYVRMMEKDNPDDLLDDGQLDLLTAL